MTGPNRKLETDLKTVTLTFLTNPVVELSLDVASVDEILKNLGSFRGAMKPEIERRPYPLGQKVEAVPDPIWVTEPDIMAENIFLHIRDPRYGWLHYLIPRSEAAKLAAMVDTRPPGPPQGKPS